MTKIQQVNGYVALGFEKVKTVFEENFKKRKELGASCCVYHKGEKVVDLWGGIKNKDTGELWEENTVAPMFSTTKGIASMAVHHAHSQGFFKFDDKMCKYWPEFAVNGKEDITIRQVFSHQAGLCAIEQPLSIEDIGNPDIVAAAIAKQKPAWKPGHKHGYHGISLGWYEGELIRRTDPKKRTIGQYFKEEIAKTLDLDYNIGLPDDFDRSRLAKIKGYIPWHMLFNLNKLPFAFVKAFLNPRSLTSRSFMNPAILKVTGNYNMPELQRIEIAAANGIGNARSVAKAYSEFATGGKILGLKKETLNAIEQTATIPIDGRMDQIVQLDTAFSLGYLKPFPELQFGSSDKAYGTPGAGGSFGFADPDTEVSFAYVMNKCGFYIWSDPRELALREATYECLAALKK